MNNKFNFAKFALDCFICFGIVIISPFVYSILIKSDDFRWLLYPIQWLLYPIQWLLYPIQWLLYPIQWLLYPIQWLLYPIQWLLYPIQWLFNIDTHTINDISILIIGFCSLSIISFFIIGFFIKYIN